MHTPDHWRARVARVNAGDTLTLRVRGGEGVREVQVTAAAPAAPDRTADDPSLGLRLRTIPKVGAEVLSVQPRSRAARAAIRQGDVITVAAGQPSPTPAEVMRAFTSLPEGGFALGRDYSRNRTSRDCHRQIMMSWSTSALLLLAGIGAGPYGLNLLSSSVLLLLDPLIVMALAMLGVFIGLASMCSASSRPRPDRRPPCWRCLAASPWLAIRDSSPIALALIALGIAGVAIVVAFAGWLLVGQADSEREQQVFVIGSLLLLGGASRLRVAVGAVSPGSSPGLCGTPAATSPERASCSISITSSIRSSS